jgi:hypothetical protein
VISTTNIPDIKDFDGYRDEVEPRRRVTDLQLITPSLLVGNVNSLG